MKKVIQTKALIKYLKDYGSISVEMSKSIGIKDISKTASGMNKYYNYDIDGFYIEKSGNMYAFRPNALPCPEWEEKMVAMANQNANNSVNNAWLHDVEEPWLRALLRPYTPYIITACIISAFALVLYVVI